MDDCCNTYSSVAARVGDQVFFSCVPGLATQRDHAMLCLYLGVESTGLAMEQQRHFYLGCDGSVIYLFTRCPVCLFRGL